MKKFHALILAIFSIALVASITFMPSVAKSSGPQKKSVSPTSIPDSIHKIFEKACMDCHAEGGNGMAESHVNFSKWDTYKPEKQADKAKAICKIVTKGNMPPKGFRKSHPDDIPTQAEINAICKWSDSLNK
jgi:cytochrome c5